MTYIEWEKEFDSMFIQESGSVCDEIKQFISSKLSEMERKHKEEIGGQVELIFKDINSELELLSCTCLKRVEKLKEKYLKE